MTIRQTRRSGLLIAVLLALSAGGCSSTPDAINPVEWYKGARDWISGDDKVEATKQAKAKEAAAQPVPDTDKAFPKLDSVPDRPPRSSAAEREQMANSLLADRDRARYSNEQLRRQDGSVARETLPQMSSTAPVPEPPVRQQVSSPVVPPVTNSIKPLPVIPEQPVPVVPNRTVPVKPSVNRAAALPTPLTPEAMPVIPTTEPPPPPEIVSGDAFATGAAPEPSSGFPEQPPEVNPSGGGPRLIPPASPPQQAQVFQDSNQFVSRLPNEQAAQQQIEEPAIFEATQAVRSGTSPIATILFADGSARIGRGDRQVIRRIYNDYRQRGGRIHVIGHASSRTRNLDQASHQLANFSISYERAQAVAGLLQRLGVPPEVIVVTAMSDQEPAYFEVMPAGEAGNRRVEIYFEN